MLEFRREEPGQRAELAAFAGRAFARKGVAEDFASLLPKLYGPQADPSPVHTLLYEDGRLAALFALQVADFTVAGCRLRTGWLGTVAVREDCRGRGHLARLMEQAQRQMAESGCDLAVLGGQRQRYGRFGFEPGGTQWQFTLQPRNIRDLPRPGETEVRPLMEADMDRVMDLWRQQPVLGPRSRDDFGLVLSSWGSTPLGLWQNGRLCGYCTCNAQGQVLELCLPDPSLLPSLLAPLLDRCGWLTVTLGPWPGPCQRMLASCSEQVRLVENHSYRIFHWQPVLEASLALRRRWSPLPEGRLLVPIGGEGCLEFDGTRCAWTPGTDGGGLTAREAVRLLWGPDSALVCASAVPPGWLPLPLAFPWLDGI